LIDGLDLEVNPGERIALVGASGSGKSTLGKIIAGLETPRTGACRIDGLPLAEWPRAGLAQRLAYVAQQVRMFEGSVRDNLSLWDASLPEGDIIRAARDARIHDVIAARPGGYDAPVAEGGVNFSGGERQRLEIARALATDPTLLILDEATSALDPVTELQVLEAVRRRGMTCILIAHRLSAIRDCDQIVVMESGRIVERGTHHALIGADGRYARLIEA
jgi:ABC-type multidrug transport system fused ATPase/permease subunit